MGLGSSPGLEDWPRVPAEATRHAMLLSRTFQYNTRVVVAVVEPPKTLVPICLPSFGHPLLVASALPGCCGIAFDLSEGDFQSTRCGWM